VKLAKLHRRLAEKSLNSRDKELGEAMAKSISWIDSEGNKESFYDRVKAREPKEE